MSYHHTTSPRYKYYNATDLNCMIHDLKPNTQYEFTVKLVKVWNVNEFYMLFNASRKIKNMLSSESF